MHDTEVAREGKRWAILGDIFELGPFAAEEHRASGRALAGTVDYLVAIGDAARFYVEGAIEAGMPEQNAYYYCANVDNAAELEAAKRAAADLLKHEIHSNDLVLLKGSRGMRMETMIDMLMNVYT
jgi:UDP-N-acetylmuramoyl-tripeptide--D-alanyl-D-alanine ligase